MRVVPLVLFHCSFFALFLFLRWKRLPHGFPNEYDIKPNPENNPGQNENSNYCFNYGTHASGPLLAS